MDWHEFFGEYGARDNGGGARALDVFSNRGLPWALVPELAWKVEVTHKDLTGSAVTAQLRNLAFTANQATDGTLLFTFSGDALDDDVQVSVPIAAADNAATISAAVEAAIDAEVDLAAVLVATTDNAGDVDVQFSSYIDVDVEWVPDWQQWSVQFEGVIADGDYDSTFVFDGYNPIVVRTTRAAGTPADAAALAVQHEADIEGNVQLVGLVVSADDDTVDTNVIVFETGAPDVVVTCSAPGTATLTPTETTGSVSVAQTEIVSVSLNQLSRTGRFPQGVDRESPGLQVLEAFGAGRTVSIGDDGAEDAVLTATDVNTVARTFGDATAAQAIARYESAWEPLATFDVGNPATLTQGRLVIEVGWSPTP